MNLENWILAVSRKKVEDEVLMEGCPFGGFPFNTRKILRTIHPGWCAFVWTESSILAQDERWRRALYMQVER